MEENVLGLARDGDIPGWEIPDVFFSFQRHGDAGRLPTVIEHNRTDVHSMFALLETLARIFHALNEKTTPRSTRASFLRSRTISTLRIRPASSRSRLSSTRSYAPTACCSKNTAQRSSAPA
jgi:hypothetical protein